MSVYVTSFLNIYGIENHAFTCVLFLIDTADLRRHVGAYDIHCVQYRNDSLHLQQPIIPDLLETHKC